MTVKVKSAVDIFLVTSTTTATGLSPDSNRVLRQWKGITLFVDPKGKEPFEVDKAGRGVSGTTGLQVPLPLPLLKTFFLQLVVPKGDVFRRARPSTRELQFSRPGRLRSARGRDVSRESRSVGGVSSGGTGIVGANREQQLGP